MARVYKGAETAVSGFLKVYHGAFLKVYGAFFACFLVGKDRGPVVISMRK